MARTYRRKLRNLRKSRKIRKRSIKRKHALKKRIKSRRMRGGVAELDLDCISRYIKGLKAPSSNSPYNIGWGANRERYFDVKFCEVERINCVCIDYYDEKCKKLDRFLTEKTNFLQSTFKILHRKMSFVGIKNFYKENYLWLETSLLDNLNLKLRDAVPPSTTEPNSATELPSATELYD